MISILRGDLKKNKIKGETSTKKMMQTRTKMTTSRLFTFWLVLNFLENLIFFINLVIHCFIDFKSAALALNNNTISESKYVELRTIFIIWIIQWEETAKFLRLLSLILSTTALSNIPNSPFLLLLIKNLPKIYIWNILYYLGTLFVLFFHPGADLTSG